MKIMILYDFSKGLTSKNHRKSLIFMILIDSYTGFEHEIKAIGVYCLSILMDFDIFLSTVSNARLSRTYLKHSPKV